MRASTGLEFEPLHLATRTRYDSLTGPRPPVSDLSLATLLIWRNFHGDLGVAQTEGGVVLSYRERADERPGYSVIAGKDPGRALLRLFDFQRSVGLPVEAIHVPQHMVDRCGSRSDLHFEEEPDFHEYLLSSERHARLEGPTYAKLRNKICRFNREAGGEQPIIELDLAEPDIRKHISASISKWVSDGSRSNDLNGDELVAIAKTLALAQDFGFRVVQLGTGERPHGIAILQPVGSDDVIVHHAKVSGSVPYQFESLLHGVGRWADQEGIATINVEMDLGIPGLRTHKHRLRPVGLHKKYRATPC